MQTKVCSSKLWCALISISYFLLSVSIYNFRFLYLKLLKSIPSFFSIRNIPDDFADNYYFVINYIHSTVLIRNIFLSYSPQIIFGKRRLLFIEENKKLQLLIYILIGI